MSDLQKFLKLKEEDVDLELEIKYNNVIEFEQLLMEFPKKLAKYHRWLAQAIKEVSDLQTEVKMLEATLIQKEVEDYQVREKKSFPMSSLQEVRKSRLFLNPEMVNLQKSLNEAEENKNYLSGLVDSWQARGYRLQELGQLLMRRTGTIAITDDKLSKAGRNLEY